MKLYKIEEEEIFIICKRFYDLYKNTEQKVDDFLFAEIGTNEGMEKMWKDLYPTYESKKIKFDKNSDEEYTIDEFKVFILKKELNKFWLELDVETRVSFLAAFATSSFRAEDTIYKEFSQVDEKINENEFMMESINYFYMIMKLIYKNEDSGYNIFQRIIRHKILDGRNFKFLKFTNNIMTINSAISLSENQKILQKKYKELEIIKINEVKNIEELNQKLSLYILLYQLRDKYNHTFFEIDNLLGEMIEDFDFESKEDFLKKIYSRKILEIIKLMKD